MPKSNPEISLFIPCLVDQVYPEIGIAMVKMLNHFGYKLNYHKRQTCCGQPAFNAGLRNEARKVAENFIDVFRDDSIIIAPSGSCIAMVRNYYPTLFLGHKMEQHAIELSKHVFEFSEFLQSENLIDKISGSYRGRVGFHNSCHSYRELRINEIPFKIFYQVQDYELIQPKGEPVCCGFGGLFSFKFAEIAGAMARGKREKFITWHGYLTYWVRQYLPWLYFLLIENLNQKFRPEKKQ